MGASAPPGGQHVFWRDELRVVRDLGVGAEDWRLNGPRCARGKWAPTEHRPPAGFRWALPRRRVWRSGSILIVASRVAVFKDDERGSRSKMLCLNSPGSLSTMFAKILDCQEWSEMVILWK